MPPLALNQCPERARVLPDTTQVDARPQVCRHDRVPVARTCGPGNVDSRPLPEGCGDGPTEARIPWEVFTCALLLPRRSPKRKRHRLPQHPSRSPPHSEGLGGSWASLGLFPWAFFDPQRAEGEATLAKALGISGATVPSSGSFFSTASSPCLCIPWGRPVTGRRAGFGALGAFPGRTWPPGTPPR